MKGRQKFDIQERTFEFAVRVVKLVNRLPRTVAAIEIGKQVVRAPHPSDPTWKKLMQPNPSGTSSTR
jgi:hypothetical protein